MSKWVSYIHTYIYSHRMEIGIERHQNKYRETKMKMKTSWWVYVHFVKQIDIRYVFVHKLVCSSLFVSYELCVPNLFFEYDVYPMNILHTSLSLSVSLPLFVCYVLCGKGTRVKDMHTTKYCASTKCRTPRLVEYTYKLSICKTYTLD